MSESLKTVTWYELMTPENKIFRAWINNDCVISFDNQVIDTYSGGLNRVYFTDNGYRKMNNEDVISVVWVKETLENELAGLHKTVKELSTALLPFANVGATFPVEWHTLGQAIEAQNGIKKLQLEHFRHAAKTLGMLSHD